MAEQATQPDGWEPPTEPRIQTKVKAVKAAKVGKVPGAVRRRD